MLKQCHSVFRLKDSIFLLNQTVYLFLTDEFITLICSLPTFEKLSRRFKSKFAIQSKCSFI